MDFYTVVHTNLKAPEFVKGTGRALQGWILVAYHQTDLQRQQIAVIHKMQAERHHGILMWTEQSHWM